jgi:hypothetical protein
MQHSKNSIYVHICCTLDLLKILSISDKYFYSLLKIDVLFQILRIFQSV